MVLSVMGVMLVLDNSLAVGSHPFIQVFGNHPQLIGCGDVARGCTSVPERNVAALGRTPSFRHLQQRDRLCLARFDEVRK
jgi:hypothetical protein